MFKLSSRLLALALLCAPAHADLLLTHAGAGKGGAAGCSQATAFIARESGSQTNNVAITTLICAMVTDGSFALLDGLLVFPTDSTADASLNLIQNAYNATVTGSLTFVANTGWTGDGSTGYLSTGFTPSTATSPNYTQNSASFGVYTLTSRTGTATYVEIGASGAIQDMFWQPLGSGQGYQINGPGVSYTPTNAQGSWLASRTSSSAVALYLNGSSVSSPSNTSGGVQNAAILVFAYNSSGTAGSFSADQLAAAWWGAGMTPTQATNFQTDLNNYMKTLGVNVY